MHSPARVAFGLRGSATESDSDEENTSWPGSELSGFSSDSDGELHCADFHTEEDLPGFEDDFPPEETKNKEAKPHPSSKETWSEIDEKARLQEQQLHPRNKPTKPSPPKAQTRYPRHDTRRGSKAETSACWRSKTFNRSRPDRKRQQKRHPRNDSPLKGAVMRPYTLPSGPITILRRPPAETTAETSDVTTIKEPGVTELENGDKSTSGGSQENDHGSCCTPIGSRARVVNTRFGEGFVVENPSQHKDGSHYSRHSSSHTEMKVARHAAMAAMAGLSMRSRDEKDGDGSMTDLTETYDRSYDGRFKQQQPYKSRPTKKPREPAVGNNGATYHDRKCRGPRPRPNVFIGRRPRIVEPRHVREDDFLLGE